MIAYFHISNIHKCDIYRDYFRLNTLRFYTIFNLRYIFGWILNIYFCSCICNYVKNVVID